MLPLLLSVFATASLVPTVSTCCINTSFQSNGTQLEAELLKLKPNLLLSDLFIAFDITSQRVFVNLITTAINGVKTTTAVYYDQIQGSTKQYVVINNTACFMRPFVGPPITNCLPDDAKVLYNITIGGESNFTVVTFTQSGDSNKYNYTNVVATVVSDSCRPLFNAVLFRGLNATESIASEVYTATLLFQYDFLPLQDPDVVTPPSICSHASSVESSGIPDDELPLLHLMDGAGSLDVFTMLSRLASLTTSPVKK